MLDSCMSYANCIQDESFVNSSPESFENLANQLAVQQDKMTRVQKELHGMSERLQSLSPWMSEDKFNREDNRLIRMNHKLVTVVFFPHFGLIVVKEGGF